MRSYIPTIGLAFVALAQVPASGQWLSPWIERDGHRYRVIEPTDWFSAEAQAQSVGGHLVTINDAEENAWVFQELMPFAPDQGAGLWIGFFQPEGSPEPASG